MIPRIYKLRSDDSEYKYGFRWGVIFGKYTLKVRTFKRAFQFWRQEVKKWTSKNYISRIKVRSNYEMLCKKN